MELKCELYGIFKGLECGIQAANITEPNTIIAKVIDVWENEEMTSSAPSLSVTAIKFERLTVNYFPRGLEKIFPNLSRISINNCGLQDISRSDLICFESLQCLCLNGNENELAKFDLPSEELKQKLNEAVLTNIESYLTSSLDNEVQGEFYNMHNGGHCTITSANIIKPNTNVTKIIDVWGNDEMTNSSLLLNVTEIAFNCAAVHYFPRGLGKILPNLTKMTVDNCGLKEISRSDLIGFENLESLSLRNNELTSLPNDLLVGMLKLKKVDLYGNKIELTSSQILEAVHRKKYQKAVYYGIPERLDVPKAACDEFHDYASYDSYYSYACCEYNRNQKQCRIEHHDKITSGFEDLWISKRFADFTIIAGIKETKEFPVHKVVLGMQSSVFAANFERDLEEKRTNTMKIQDFSADTVEQLLYFFYHGKIQDEKHAMELFALAGKHDVEELKKIAKEIIYAKIDSENAFEVFTLAESCNENDMKSLAFAYVQNSFPAGDLADDLIDKPEELKAIFEAKRGRKNVI
jgi:hypothetical protein